MKEPQKVDMHIFRENTEDIYAGIEWEAGTPEAEKFYRFLHDEMGVAKVRFPESSSFGVKPVSKEGTERLVRAACKYALEHGLPSVTLVHKGNIMKFTEGGFKKWGYELAEREFGDAVASGKLVIKRLHSRCILAEYVIDSRRIFGGGYLELERRLYLGSVGCHGRRHRNCSRSEHQLQYRSCHF